MLFRALFNIALLGAVVAADTPPIVVKGNAFFDSETNRRFYIRGLAYQPGGSSKLEDPLADPDTCARDVPLFKELGINTIRVYTVDNTKDHSECMDLLSENGIYLLLDVSTPLSSIARDSPACSYNSRYLRHVFATIDEFARYDNVLGFFAGNEVINDVGSTNAAPYVKAVVRDMKKYLRARDYRQIPVGYSAADVTENRVPTAHYFNCGDDEDERIDMFGINDYSYCGTSYQASGYGIKMKEFANYSIPVFLSEYGCNTGGSERHFNEVSSIYSRTMSSVFSGGIVYEYSNEANNYGLVNIIDKDTVEKLPDFDNLKEQFSETSDPEGGAGYSEDLKYSVCPTNSTRAWIVRDKVPSMPEGAKKYFTRGAGKGKGMKYSTQNSCGLEDVEEDDEDDDVSVESSTSTSTTITTATTMSTSTSTSTSASTEETTSHSMSSSSRTSRSSDAAGILEVPTVVKLLYHIIFSLL